MTVQSKIEAAGLNRRAFLVASGAAGVAVGFATLPDLRAALGATTAGASYSPSPWYVIGTDGRVVVTVGKAEMGQHIASTMAQLVAEELGAAWKDMSFVLASNDPRFNDPVLGAQITGGSWSTGMNFETMCRAGAAGRIALTEAGARMIGVKPGECFAADSLVIHDGSDKKISFAEIVRGGNVNRAWTPEQLQAITLKARDDYALIGRSLPQLDIPAKTNGTAKYGIDAMLPGMLYGRPVVPPVRYGASVKSVDDGEAKKVKGFVSAVVLSDPTKTTTGWVVAVADSYEGAKAAAEALKVDYDLGRNAHVDDAAILAESRRLQLHPAEGVLFVKNGDSAAALGRAAHVMQAEYTTSLNIHAPMEPMNALAAPQGDSWHIYIGNQFNTRTTAIAAACAGVDASKVVIHQHLLGGGFGRRLESDMVIPAVLAAKAVGKPVKVIYAREDDMRMDFTRPLTYQHVKVGLDAAGKVSAMEHDVIGAWPTARWGIPAFLVPAVDHKGVHDGFTVNGADYWYTVPNHTVRNFENQLAQSATPSGQLRSVAPGWTFWATESMWDEVAHATGRDPVELRLAMLDGAGDNKGGANRLANVLRIAVGRAGYGSLTLAKNEGLGVACVSSQERAHPTWTACVAQVTVDPSSGEVKVKRLTVAMDLGTVVNPDGVRAQIEGSTFWGMSLALLEKASMQDGGIEQQNFDTYTPMRMSQVPELDISIVGNGEPAQGCGEPAVTVVAPAIANAIFNAVGARVRALPITADAVKAAMKA